jgi:hypothetical protein
MAFMNPSLERTMSARPNRGFSAACSPTVDRPETGDPIEM